MGNGFSHVGVSTHDMDTTIQFYEEVLGFRRVAEDHIRIVEGGNLRHVFFDVGDGQCIAFIQANDVPAIPSDYDTSINLGLGVPHAMYHYALKVLTLEELESRRRELEARGVAVSPIIDLGAGRSIFFRDPNNITLEFCCQLRPFNESDLQGEFETSVAMLG
jgi:catechol 2,3-dioxygenase-like lactoylglutathione lyase family enzyme